MGGGKSGFGDKQAQSEAKAEQRMRSAENSIRESNTEHALIFDRNGNIIKQLDGDIEGYEMDEEAERLLRIEADTHPNSTTVFLHPNTGKPYARHHLYYLHRKLCDLARLSDVSFLELQLAWRMEHS